MNAATHSHTQVVHKNMTLPDKILKTIIKDRYLLLMMVPGLLIYIFFCYMPMYGVVIAFKDFNPMQGIMQSPWVGMKYFTQFFQSAFFTRLLQNTVLLSVYNLIWAFPIPIIFALFLNELKNGPFKKITQTISYLPHFISVVVVVGMMVNMFSPTGIVPAILTKTLGTSPRFLSDSKLFRTMYIGSELWQHFGWNSIIYIAALTGIDQQLYEAAKIDGANRLKQMIHIAIPSIAPTIIILLILSCGSILSVGFEKIILMYSPATYSTADVISTYSYRVGLLQSQYSFGSAVGLFNSLANCIILIGVNYISRRVSTTSLW
jgi:putative aldouronate transport system permease protein